MKKYFKIIILIGLVCFTTSYLYYMRPIVDDELFNYGFAKNIVDGLIPYKDFNMIVPPLFSYLLALILGIFGKKLIIYHSVLSILIISITYISYKKIKKFSLLIYLLLLIYPYTGYNMFCLFLLFLLLTQRENEKSYLIEPILISAMFLTKQTLGLLIIPSIIYSKQKRKTILIYIVNILLFFLYLVINNNIFQFLDYCLFGMFDFAEKNNTGVNFLLIFECFLMIGLMYITFKTKRKDIFYVLLFQIITFPIVDYYHFIISFIPVVYLLFLKIHKVKYNRYIFLLTTTTIFSFFLMLNYMFIKADNNYLFLYHYDVNNFMKGRLTYRVTSTYVFKVKEILDEYEEYDSYILGNFSYLIKLNNNMPINKYDLINNGNMGYHGCQKYLQEIKDNCKEKKCIFIINDEEEVTTKKIQTNRNLLKYVKKNYNKKYSSTVFSVYTN